MNRRAFLRWLALLLGVALLFAHIAVWKEPGIRPHWLYLDPHDALYHFTALTLFTVVYYLSFPPNYKGRAVSAALACAAWGAFCEVIQHWIPARDFSVIELGINMLTPVLAAGFLRLILRR